jgi:hypothetical protein
MTGWTWDEVRDQLDLPRVEALRKAWEHNPPLAITMRAAAEAQGVEFKGGKLLGESVGSAPLPEGNLGSTADPFAVMAELGQAEARPYVAPLKGLPIGPAEQPTG